MTQSLEAQLLSEFYQTSDPMDEQALCKKLSISSAQLDQFIKDLRLCGFSIESIPHRGYRLTESPDSLIADDLYARLTGSPSLGKKILVFEKTASTNNVVQRFALEGADEGLIVFAESQTAGRGRQGRKWISPAKKGLWFSVLLRPKLSIESASRITVSAAVAVAASLRKTTQLPLKIKWPNDIFCNGKKLGGILVELSLDSQQILHAIVGMGINVNLKESDFPSELRSIATSLQIEAGREFHRPSIAADLMMEFDRCYQLTPSDEFSSILDRWVEMDFTLGKQVSVRSHHGIIRGLATSLDSDGALLLRMDTGQIERIVSGEITLS